MKKILYTYLFLVVCSLVFFVHPTFAIVNPKDYPNNKFGIHIAVADARDITDASNLLNSNGGEWGYVTIVIQESDRDKGKWQGIFNLLRRQKLIPLVRIATHPEGENWRRPTKEDAAQWAEFLNSLRWVTKNRYVMLFNEPNHASEWGGAVNPEDYAEVSFEFAKALKARSPDFFVMLGGLDQVAPEIFPGYSSEDYFLQRMFSKVTPEQFAKVIDGWNSHSYPNPDFSGSTEARGRGSVGGYQWELEYIRSLGFNKDLPVFITETGWRRSEYIPESEAADRLANVYENLWLPDNNIIAVTPFVLNYQGEPFLDFSWRKYQSDEFHTEYSTIQEMKKIKGEPEFETQFLFLDELPKHLLADSHYTFLVPTQNTGQSIWGSNEGYEFALLSADNFKYHFFSLDAFAPEEQKNVAFYIETPKTPGKFNPQIVILRKNKVVSNTYTWKLDVTTNYSIKIGYTLFFNNIKTQSPFQVELYDKDERLVFKKSDLVGHSGVIELTGVKNVVPGQTYRVVLLKPKYLPRQTYATVVENKMITLKTMYPFDRNEDGKLSVKDVIPFSTQKKVPSKSAPR